MLHITKIQQLKKISLRYDLYAYEHPFNQFSRCVRTTFLNRDVFSREDAPLITNFISPKGHLTRIFGTAKFDKEAKGYEIDYYAVRK